jgi:hypothetical protein
LLAKGIIQFVPRGAVPSRVITAPEPCDPIYSMTSEAERLAQFEHSRYFHARRAAESGAPGVDYDQELSEGFELKYGRA